MRFLDTSRIRTRFDERVFAPDGTELSVDLYLPPQPGRYPSLLVRTPADNNNRPGRPAILPSEVARAGSAGAPPAERWKVLAARGYIVAAADVRGRGDSDGKFVPFLHEAGDGAATIAWLRRLDECDGKIGLFGSGYGAFCAWAAAVADGNVDAVASISPFGAMGNGLVHRGGAMRLDWLFWMHLIGGRTVQASNVPPWPSIHRHLPLRTMDEALGREDIWWRDWLEHLDVDDPLWAPLDLADRIAALKVPGLHITGWWDGQAAAAHYYYEAMCRGGAPQRLIIGPWDTTAVRRPVPHVGGFDFGPRSVIDLDETLADFFDTCLRAEGPRNPAEARIFVTGRNEWVACEDCSADAESHLKLHLSSTLGANTRGGDGTLSNIPPQNGGVDNITHNPAFPVEFQPQFVSFAIGANPLGFTLDQAHVTSRDEALVYTSPVLEQPVTVFGRPKVTFTVCTARADADVYVLLSDSFPLGSRDLHLSHAAIRLATLGSFRCGVPVTVELVLDMIAHDFLPDHQIRLTITPSLFPLYARNLHVAEYSSADKPVIADIELHHGSTAAAYLTLPLRQAAGA